MDRKAFVKLAAASPALASPIYVGGSDGNPDGDASGTVIGSPSPDSQTAFTFYSPLAEQWYRGGQYFEWTSTTRNNEGRRVNVFYRTFGSRSNPALVIFHGYYRHSFDWREFIPFLEDDYFVAILDFPGFGFSDKPLDGYSYMIEDDAKLMDYFVREILGLSRFQFLTHDRGGSVGFAFLGNYIASEEKEYEITYHFITNGGLYQPLLNFEPGRIPFDFAHPVRGPEVTRGAAGPAPGDGRHAGTGRRSRHSGVQRRDQRAASRWKVPAGADSEAVPLAGQPSQEPGPDRADVGVSGHAEPGTHRQSHLVQLPRQEGGGEQLLAPACGSLPPSGHGRGDGRDRPHLPGGGDPRSGGRERVYAGAGSEQDRDVTRLRGSHHHRGPLLREQHADRFPRVH